MEFLVSILGKYKRKGMMAKSCLSELQLVDASEHLGASLAALRGTGSLYFGNG